MNIAREEHYTKIVWVSKSIECKRKKNCLCLNCELLLKCTPAKHLYDLCKFEDLALAGARCPTFRLKKTEP